MVFAEKSSNKGIYICLFNHSFNILKSALSILLVIALAYENKVCILLLGGHIAFWPAQWNQNKQNVLLTFVPCTFSLQTLLYAMSLFLHSKNIFP